jgi:type IV secretion system protein TrbL
VRGFTEKTRNDYAGSAAMSPLRRAAASLRESFAAGGRAVTGEGGAAGSAAEAGAAAGQAGALGP